MTHIGVRPSRALLGALLVVLGMLLWFAGLARAGFDIARGSTIEVDEDTNWWNGTTVRSYGGYQYITYWDAPDAEGRVYLKLTRRTLSSGAQESITFNGAGGTTAEALVNLNDGHDTAQVGLSPIDGRIHLDWSIHHNRNHWGLSSRECMTAARLSSCTFDWSRTMTTAVDRPRETRAGTTTATENTFTYPFYFNDANGNLYISYRFGESFRGNVWINRYNNDGTWTSLGLVIRGRFETIDWSGGRGRCDEFGNIVEPERNPSVACHRGVYIAGMQFDTRNRLHVMWEYKEYASALAGEGLRGIYYMYSDDLGRTWRNNAGTQVATANTDPLLPYSEDSEATKVYEAPFGQWARTSTYMAMDSNNQPHLVISLSDVNTSDAQLQNQRLLHLWRTGTSSWHNSWIESAGNGPEFAFGSLVFDGADNAYEIYNHNALDWSPWNSEPYILRDLPPYDVTWQGRDFLNIVPYSRITGIATVRYVNTRIGTGAGENNTITVRLKNRTAGTRFEVNWTTDARPEWTIGQNQVFTISANDTEYHTYTFRVTDADWTGNLRWMEILPIGIGSFFGAERDISIDYIRIGDERGTYAKRWEFQAGNSVYLASSSADDNYERWTVESLLPSVSEAGEDSVVSVDTQRYRDSGIFAFPVTEQGSPGVESVKLHEFPLTSDTVLKGWAFPVDEQGWTQDGARSLTSFEWRNDGGVLGVTGVLRTTGSTIDSNTYLNLPVTASNSVTVRLKNSTTATQAKLWFITYSNRTWLPEKTRTVEITPESGYRDYTFDMSRVSGWAGERIYQISLEPAVGVGRGSFAVDRITINR